MDRLSVAASIISVAGALYAVSRKLRSYAKTMSYAAKEVKAVAKEINLFSILLRSLQYTYDTLTSRVSQAADLLKLCERLVAQAKENVGEFKSFLKALDPLHSSRGGGLISRTVARLKWAYQKSDVVLLRSKLESSKSTLSLCMVAIETRIMTEMYVAALNRGGDEREIRRLKRQVRMLESQLRDQRSVVKDAIAASQNIEQLIRGKVRSSLSLEVTNEALSVAKKQLHDDSNRDSAQVYPHHVFTPPNNPSRPPSPRIAPSPPPAPLRPGPPTSPPQPHVSTGDAGRRRSTVSFDTTPVVVSVRNDPEVTVHDDPEVSVHNDPEVSVHNDPEVSVHNDPEVSVHDDPDPTRNVGVAPIDRWVPPTASDVGIDVGHRIARASTRQRQPGSMSWDADRKIWRDHHQGDDEGL